MRAGSVLLFELEKQLKALADFEKPTQQKSFWAWLHDQQSFFFQ